MPPHRIAIFIKTFNRPNRLLKCVERIQAYCNQDYRIYIADDGESSPAVADLYRTLTAGGHFVRTYPGRVNVTTARNELVGELRDERYVLRLDDDFNFSERTDLAAMLRIMAHRPEIGALSGLECQLGDGKGIKSGQISNKQGHMIIRDGILYKFSVPADQWLWSNADGLRFAYANYTRNFLLIRREVFQTVKWNEELPIQGEHSAFMIDLQKAGWALAFTPESIHEHDETSVDDTSKQYKNARHATQGRKRQQEVFLKCYGIRAMKGLDANDALIGVDFHNIRKGVMRLVTGGSWRV